MEYEKIKLERDGILTPVDERKITEKLMGCKGIQSVKAIFRSGFVLVEFDPEYASEEAIDDFLTELGYPAGDGLLGFWMDIICTVSIVAGYILASKFVTRMGWDFEQLIPLWAAGLGALAGLFIAAIGLKMWGVVPFLAKWKIKFADAAPKHYNGVVYKIITFLLTEAGIIIFSVSMAGFGF